MKHGEQTNIVFDTVKHSEKFTYFYWPNCTALPSQQKVVWPATCSRLSCFNNILEVSPSVAYLKGTETLYVMYMDQAWNQESLFLTWISLLLQAETCLALIWIQFFKRNCEREKPAERKIKNRRKEKSETDPNTGMVTDSLETYHSLMELHYANEQTKNSLLFLQNICFFNWYQGQVSSVAWIRIGQRWSLFLSTSTSSVWLSAQTWNLHKVSGSQLHWAV